MKLLRYGRHDNDLLMEISCHCNEIFSFVASYKDDRLTNEPITCPNCKQASTVKTLLPKEFLIEYAMHRETDRLPQPPAPTDLAPFSTDLSCPDCGFILPIEGTAPLGAMFTIISECHCEAMTQKRTVRVKKPKP